MKQDRFIRLTFDDHPESITFVNLRHIKRFGANDSGGSYVHIKGDNRVFKETPEQILAQIGGAPQLPEEWMAAANTAHDIRDVLQRLESNFDDSKPEAIKRCISSLVKDAVSLEATLHAIPGRSNP